LKEARNPPYPEMDPKGTNWTAASDRISIKFIISINQIAEKETIIELYPKRCLEFVQIGVV